MQLTDFDKVRVGNEWPIVVDVSKMGNHCAYGLISSFSTMNYKDEDYFLQVRRHNDSKEIAVLQFRWDDQELPSHWGNSEVIFDSRKQTKNQ